MTEFSRSVAWVGISGNRETCTWNRESDERQRGPDAAGRGGQHTRHAPAEEITQERFGEFAAQPNWTVATVWQWADAAPYGVAFYNGLAGERVRVTFENARYRLTFEITRAVSHLHSAGEVIDFVREVESRLCGTS